MELRATIKPINNTALFCSVMELDIDSMSRTAVAFLVPVVKGGIEGAAEFVGDKVSRRLWDMVKNKLKGNRDDARDMDSFVQNPERYQDHFVAVLKENMESDNRFAADMSAIIKEIQAQATSIIDRAKADDIQGQDIGTMKSGVATSHIKDSKAKKITGQKIGHIG
ncbi:MAG: hypothetical protein OEW49_04990 [Nitrosopumilus sp.]|nr:hypothetical protein [Nitrosopumilus sp.]